MGKVDPKVDLFGVKVVSKYICSIPYSFSELFVPYGQVHEILVLSSDLQEPLLLAYMKYECR